MQGSGEGLQAYGYHVQRIEELIDSDAMTSFGLDSSTFLVTTSSYTQNIKRTITNGTDFHNPTLDITPINQNQDLNISERFNKLTYKYTTQELFRKEGELILNNDFDKGTRTHNNTSKFPKYFEISSNISATNACQLIAAGNFMAGNTSLDRDLSFRSYQQATNLPPYPGAVSAQGQTMSTISSMANYYIRTSGTESGDTVDAQTKVMSNIQCSVLDSLRIKLKGKITKGVDYGYAEVNGLNNQNYLTSPVFHFGLKVKLHYDNGTKYTWWMNTQYPSYGQNKWTVYNGTAATTGDNIVHQTIGTKSYSSSAKSGVLYHEDDFELELDSAMFPQNGLASISIYFYIPRTESTYMQPIGLANCIMEEISCKYVTDGDFSDDIIKNLTFFTLTDAKENRYNFKVHYGDGPAEYHLSSFRYGVVSVSDQYKITSSWRKLDDATARTAANIFNMIPAQRLLSSYQREIRGDYMGIFDIVNTLNIDDGTDDLKYMIMGDSWDVKANIHSLKLREITPESISITVGDEQRTYEVKPATNESNVAVPVPSTTSIKLVGAVILNPPVTLNPSSIQTNYPA